MALTDKLTAIADAIRSKTGNNAGLTLDQMPGAIAGIQGGSGGSCSSADCGHLIYELPEPTYFNGVDTFIDTGVAPLNKKWDFTILMDFTSEGKGFPFHCMVETSPYNGMHMRDSLYSSYPNYWCITIYGKTYFPAISPLSADRYRISMTGNLDGSFANTLVSVVSGSVLTIHSSGSYRSFAPIEQTLVLGAQKLANGNLQGFWKGTMHDFKILNRTLGTYERQTYRDTGKLYAD